MIGTYFKLSICIWSVIKIMWRLGHYPAKCFTGVSWSSPELHTLMGSNPPWVHTQAFIHQVGAEICKQECPEDVESLRLILSCWTRVEGKPQGISVLHSRSTTNTYPQCETLLHNKNHLIPCKRVLSVSPFTCRRRHDLLPPQWSEDLFCAMRWQNWGIPCLSRSHQNS